MRLGKSKELERNEFGSTKAVQAVQAVLAVLTVPLGSTKLTKGKLPCHGNLGEVTLIFYHTGLR